MTHAACLSARWGRRTAQRRGTNRCGREHEIRSDEVSIEGHLCEERAQARDELSDKPLDVSESAVVHLHERTVWFASRYAAATHRTESAEPNAWHISSPFLLGLTTALTFGSSCDRTWVRATMESVSGLPRRFPVRGRCLPSSGKGRPGAEGCDPGASSNSRRR